MEGLRPAETEVGLVPAAASGDVAFAAGLAALVNEVYAVAEEGLWLDGVARTTSAELAGLMRVSELAVARRAGAIVGCVRIQRLDDYRGQLGMLVADPSQRGTGIGRALIHFAEELSVARGLRMMQLELLVPRDWTHPIKMFLEGWYTRSGYRLVRTERPEEAYPHLAPFLATACDLRIYHKVCGRAGESGVPAGADQACFVGDHYELRAVPGAELDHRSADVGLGSDRRSPTAQWGESCRHGGAVRAARGGHLAVGVQTRRSGTALIPCCRRPAESPAHCAQHR